MMIAEIGKKSEGEGRPFSRLPTLTDDAKKKLIGSADFLGLNYYTARLVAPLTQSSLPPSLDNDLGLEYFTDPNWKQGKSSWLYIVPQGLFDLLKWIKMKYANPLVIITENGYSDDGQLNDDDRIDYLKAHLASVSRAVSEGCNIDGFMVWSILDNFEWLSGFTEHFGIYAVNMTSPTKERIEKKSVQFFKSLVADKKFVY